MQKRYFRMSDPKCKPEEIEWIEMTGREFYSFVHSPEGKDRHFIDMDDVVLEGSSSEARKQQAEKDHRDYLKEQEAGWSTLSIYSLEGEHGCSGEEVVVDETQNVETEAMKRIERKALAMALSMLEKDSYHLIHAMYLAEKKKQNVSLHMKRCISGSYSQAKKESIKDPKILGYQISKKFPIEGEGRKWNVFALCSLKTK